MRDGHSAVRRVRMSVVYDKNRFLSNIKRQSLRLTQILEIPQNQAHILLSKYFYGENSLSEVKRKINAGKFERRLFLAAVAPDADQNILNMFAEQFPEILISVTSSPVATIYDGNCAELILEVFSLNSEHLQKSL